MTLSAALLLLQTSDPAMAMAQAEAKIRKTVVALPLLSGATPRPGEGWRAFAERSSGRLAPTAEGLARIDRPLLLSARSMVEDLDVRGWPMLGPISKLVAETSDEDVKQSGGRFRWEFASMPEGIRGEVKSTFDRINGEGVQVNGVAMKDLPETALSFFPSFQVMLRPEKGNWASFYVQGPNAPFDPTAILDKLRWKDPDPVPKALADAVKGQKVVLPGTNQSLAKWVTLLKGKDFDLKLDARAADWRTAMAGSTNTVPLAEALRAVARSHRLYWRSLGNGWMLAASPGDPRPFSLEIMRSRAKENLYAVLDRMARLGLVSEDGLVLLTVGQKKVSELTPDESARLNRLFQNRQPSTMAENGDKQFQAILNSANVGQAYVSAGISLNINMINQYGTQGFGVSSP